MAGQNLGSRRGAEKTKASVVFAWLRAFAPLRETGLGFGN